MGIFRGGLTILWSCLFCILNHTSASLTQKDNFSNTELSDQCVSWVWLRPLIVSCLTSVVPDNHPCVIVDTFKSRSLLSRYYPQQPLRLELEAHIACAPLCMASFLWVDLTWISNLSSTQERAPLWVFATVVWPYCDLVSFAFWITPQQVLLKETILAIQS